MGAGILLLGVCLSIVLCIIMLVLFGGWWFGGRNCDRWGMIIVLLLAD
jgi:hypothetical protein